LTPDGKKRNPMSFGPFLGGKRICLGKTFAETTAKIVAPSILYNFDLDFINPELLHQKPENNSMVTYVPEIMVKITDRPI